MSGRCSGNTKPYGIETKCPREDRRCPIWSIAGMALTSTESLPTRDQRRCNSLTARVFASFSTNVSGKCGRASPAGLPGKQFASNLGISVRTVEVHRARILRRLGVRNMAEAVRLWTLARH